MSLLEILVATAIASIVMVIIAGEMSSLSSRFIASRERLEAEGTAARAERLFKQLLSQAYYITNNIVPGNNGAGPGGILAVNCNTIAACPGWTTLAVFQFEAQQGLWGVGGVPPNAATGGTSGMIRRAAIFYLGPQPGAQGSGVIFFHNDGLGGRMQPSYADEFVDRVSFLSIAKNVHPYFDLGSGPPVTSVDISLKIRYHMTNAWGLTWCPQADIIGLTPGCLGGTMANYQDVERTFNVVLRNNLLHDNTPAPGFQPRTVSGEERVSGDIYYFAPHMPQNN